MVNNIPGITRRFQPWGGFATHTRPRSTKIQVIVIEPPCTIISEDMIHDGKIKKGDVLDIPDYGEARVTRAGITHAGPANSARQYIVVEKIGTFWEDLKNKIHPRSSKWPVKLKLR